MAMSTLDKPAVFLDKDGTVVEDVPYNIDPALLRFTPGACAALHLLSQHGYALVIVTNQPGLALGRFDRQAWMKLRHALVDLVRHEAGVTLEDVLACPHAPTPRIAPGCLCRKPAPGLLRQAAARHHLDLHRSWMVGDILDDVEAGRRAGCRTVLLDVGHETEWRDSPLRVPDHRAPNLYEAAQWLVAQPRVHAQPAYTTGDAQLPCATPS